MQEHDVDQKQKQGSDQIWVEAEAADSPINDAAAGGDNSLDLDAADDSSADPVLKLAQIRAEAQDYLQNWQRLQAEFDNYRKRTQREREELLRYASERLVKTLLSVLDNFERALTSAQTHSDFQGFAQGVEMIFRQFSDVLAKEGLQVIETQGQTFDPSLHEAIFREESGTYPENTILEEVQKGYLLKDKVIRHSMVKVSGE
ncbi:MAG: nucleotide exchange factor GrpE [Peptococcaceae bacterium]|jgi:molecular chaperone GrpE|nr:nucleotide exchange factor GrpE [Peptococcaceae bacterium]